MAHGLRLFLWLAEGRSGQPSAAILDARTVQSTRESGADALLERIPASRDEGALRAFMDRHTLVGAH